METKKKTPLFTEERIHLKSGLGNAHLPHEQNDEPPPTPERLLLVAMVERALRDLTLDVTSSREAKINKADAAWWFTSSSDKPWSFQWTMEHVELPIEFQTYVKSYAGVVLENHLDPVNNQALQLKWDYRQRVFTPLVKAQAQYLAEHPSALSEQEFSPSDPLENTNDYQPSEEQLLDNPLFEALLGTS